MSAFVALVSSPQPSLCMRAPVGGTLADRLRDGPLAPAQAERSGWLRIPRSVRSVRTSFRSCRSCSHCSVVSPVRSARDVLPQSVQFFVTRSVRFSVAANRCDLRRAPAGSRLRAGARGRALTRWCVAQDGGAAQGAGWLGARACGASAPAAPDGVVA